MLKLNKAKQIAQNGKPHNFVFVAKGDDRRKGGYLIHLPIAKVSSTYHEGTVNLQLENGQYRKLYWCLLIKLDNVEIHL